ncbi:MAG TPA: FdtA/QdtA family cupin domain-containing protein [Blastocatellia bacterium]|nr:FdtA/QdtA family cupin domain-containing protein [Blastocatellia bacterium]
MSLAEAYWVSLPRSVDTRGILTAIEGGRDIPFEIRRIFYLHGTPDGVERGGHAHRDTRQILIAVAGQLSVDLSDGTETRTFRLTDPNQGLFVPAMTWVRLYGFSRGAVCLVLADTHYDRARSLRSWGEFRQAVEKLAGQSS